MRGRDAQAETEAPSMSSHGSKVCCPTCETLHVVRVGEIKAQRQIAFTCASCGTAITIDADIAEAADVPRQAERPIKVEIKSVT
jgi:transcription elongation factor Elf1